MGHSPCPLWVISGHVQRNSQCPLWANSGHCQHHVRQTHTLIDLAPAMSRYQLVQYLPPEKWLHGLNGYKEVIDTVSWGLEQLGHQVTYSVGRIDSGATNIIFGAQVIPVAMLKELPHGTIIYNFEQLRGFQ